MSLLTSLGNLFKKDANAFIAAKKPQIDAGIDALVAEAIPYALENGDKAIPFVSSRLVLLMNKLKFPAPLQAVLVVVAGASLTHLEGKSGPAATAILQQVGEKLKHAVDGARF